MGQLREILKQLILLLIWFPRNQLFLLPVYWSKAVLWLTGPYQRRASPSQPQTKQISPASGAMTPSSSTTTAPNSLGIETCLQPMVWKPSGGLGWDGQASSFSLAWCMSWYWQSTPVPCVVGQWWPCTPRPLLGEQQPWSEVFAVVACA